MATPPVNIDNSSDLANDLFTALTSGITVPDVPDFSDSKYSFDPSTDASNGLYDNISEVSLSEVTTGDSSVSGTGAFDVFMQAIDAHLQREFKSNRITGSEYAEVYTAVANQAMGQAVSFVLQKDQAKWAAVTTQMQARIAEIQATTALVELEKSKIEAANATFQLNLTAAQYGLTKMQIASEEARHDGITVENAQKEYQLNYAQPADVAIKLYERESVMPSIVAMNNVQVDRILPAQASIAEFENLVLQPLQEDLQILQRDRVVPAAASIEEFRLNSMLPVELAQQQHILNQRQPLETSLVKEQLETQRANTLDTRSDGLTPVSGMVGLQKRNLTVDADIKDYNLTNTLPTQLQLLSEQITMTAEQGEAERAKTLDNRSDGASVAGSVGKQKELYTQQVDSFIKDAQHKAAKMYLDSWITRKTLDDGVPVPSEFAETTVSSVIANIKKNNSL